MHRTRRTLGAYWVGLGRGVLRGAGEVLQANRAELRSVLWFGLALLAALGLHLLGERWWGAGWADKPLPGWLGSYVLLAGLQVLCLAFVGLVFHEALFYGRRVKWGLLVAVIYFVIKGLDAWTPPPGPPLTPVNAMNVLAVGLLAWGVKSVGMTRAKQTPKE